MADMVVRYDLEKMQAEVKTDFSPEAGSHRLLNQSDISKRFRRRTRPQTTNPPSDS